MKLYHVSRTRSVRVLWLLEELGLDYELETMPFDPKALQSKDYLELSPFGKVPGLIDGATTMFESVFRSARTPKSSSPQTPTLPAGKSTSPSPQALTTASTSKAPPFTASVVTGSST